KFKIMKTLGLNGVVEDMLITLSDQIHLVKLINSATFLYLSVDRKQSNVAIVRTSVNRNCEKFI
ncbi:MAG TPA: hypothetical protein VMG12_41495, partial [Polyangiaceae bacterium]|nr:hypothetical protein [Polyangiaceae bacterium]